MIDPTPSALDLPGARLASRVRGVLAQACQPPAPCASAAVVAVEGDAIESIARFGHGRLAVEEQDAARRAAGSGAVVVLDEHDAPIVAAPAGDGLAVVARLRQEASPERIERVEALAGSVALALEAERLAGVAGRARRELFEAADAIAERAAYDLHDGPAPKVVWARNALRSLERGDGDASLDTVRDVLDSAVADLQHVIGRLLDPVSTPVPPLELLVREELELAARRTGVATHLELPAPLPGLDPAVAEAAYRLVQEAISNAVTHGGAGRLSVAVACDEGQLSVTVADDGAGFDVPAAGDGARRAAGRGLGLRGMRERVAAAGGDLTVTSSFARGTRVRARLPLRLASQADG